MHPIFREDLLHRNERELGRRLRHAHVPEQRASALDLELPAGRRWGWRSLSHNRASASEL
jgi:hypothetical protein